jgi:hypothetical protein
MTFLFLVSVAKLPYRKGAVVAISKPKIAEIK